MHRGLNPFQIRVVIQTMLAGLTEAVRASLNPFQIRVVIQTYLLPYKNVCQRLNPFQIRVVIQTRTPILLTMVTSLSQSLSDQGSHSDIEMKNKVTIAGKVSIPFRSG